jgi:hypothetical protein
MMIAIGNFIGANNVSVAAGGGTPTIQASSVVITGITSTTLTFSWTNGNGSKRLILMKASSVVSSNPSDDTTYTASTTFGSGAQIGTGNYTVYNNTGNSVTVTGLTADTVYHIRIFEYNGIAGAEKYFADSASGNPVSQLTFTTEFQLKLDRADALTIIKPSLAWQITENGMIKSFITDFAWTEADKIYCLKNDGSKQFGELELKSPTTHRLTEVANGGALIFTSGEGTKSDGLAYYDAGFALSAMTQFQIEDCYIGTVWFNLAQSNAQTTGCRSSASSRATIVPRNASNQMSSIVNSGTALMTTYTASSTWNFLGAKRDAGTQTNTANGATSSSAIPAVAIPTANFSALAINNAGVVTAGSQVQSSLGFICVGSKDLDGILTSVQSFF